MKQNVLVKAATTEEWRNRIMHAMRGIVTLMFISLALGSLCSCGGGSGNDSDTDEAVTPQSQSGVVGMWKEDNPGGTWQEWQFLSNGTGSCVYHHSATSIEPQGTFTWMIEDNIYLVVNMTYNKQGKQEQMTYRNPYAIIRLPDGGRKMVWYDRIMFKM